MVNEDWRNFKSKKEWEIYFKYKIPRNNELLKRSILVIYELQTNTEQEKEQTKERNGVGFNSADDKVLSKIAKKLKNKEQLTNKELEIARLRITKYWKQLMMHALQKMGENK